MIQITAQMRILVCVESVDFRKGIDGLCRVCRKELGADPFCGTLFVFRNRSNMALRILVYDGQGFWLCHKRVGQGVGPRQYPGSVRGSGHVNILNYQVKV